MTDFQLHLFLIGMGGTAIGLITIHVISAVNNSLGSTSRGIGLYWTVGELVDFRRHMKQRGSEWIFWGSLLLIMLSLLPGQIALLFLILTWR